MQGHDWQGQDAGDGTIGVVLEPNAATRAALTETLEALGVHACVASGVDSCVGLLGQGAPSAARAPRRDSRVVAIIASLAEATEAAPALLDLVMDRVYTPPIVVTVAPAVEQAAARLLGRSVWAVLPKPASVASATRVVAGAVEEGRRRLGDWLMVQDYRQREAQLSHAELQVLAAVCQGKLNKQIAREMGVSVRTIEQRRRRVFTTMNVASAAPLAERLATVRTLERVHAPRRAVVAPIGVTPTGAVGAPIG